MGPPVTSNLVPADQLLKKKQVAFCENSPTVNSAVYQQMLASSSNGSTVPAGHIPATVTSDSVSAASNSNGEALRNNNSSNNNNNTTAMVVSSPMNVGIEDFLKEHKTLNVNMNITEGTGASMNNKINFDSEKFARHGYLDNTRPATTIENLNNTGESSSIDKSANVKRLKSCNLNVEEAQVKATIYLFIN